MFANRIEAARAGLRRREDFAAQAGLMRLFAGIEQTLHTFDAAASQLAQWQELGEAEPGLSRLLPATSS